MHVQTWQHACCLGARDHAALTWQHASWGLGSMHMLTWQVAQSSVDDPGLSRTADPGHVEASQAQAGATATTAIAGAGKEATVAVAGFGAGEGVARDDG